LRKTVELVNARNVDAVILTGDIGKTRSIGKRLRQS